MPLENCSFIAIDFETANPRRVSACALGVVKVVSGKVLDKKSYLIKPVGEFARLNIRVHGIRPEMTEHAPTFDRLFQDLREDVENLPILSYSTFDQSVLHALMEHYALSLNKQPRHIDVYALARERLPGLPNYKLPTVTSHLNLPDFTHHDACDDALMCAEVFLKLIDAGGADGVPQQLLDAPRRDWRTTFVDFAEMIMADGVIEEWEACQLLGLLDEVSNESKLLRDVAAVTEDILADRVVTREESDLLIALLRYAIHELRRMDGPQGGDWSSPLPAPPVESQCAEKVRIEVPDLYCPVLKILPEKYRERWDFVKASPFKTLASSNVVITEEGLRIGRVEAEQLVQRLGGNLKGGVSRVTDFCVVLGIPPERCSTGKIRKAREMQSQGSPIRILCEEEFIELVRASLAEHA